jgi:hypothetical protein
MIAGKLDPSTLEKGLCTLLSELCIEWGFCIPPADATRIIKRTHITADEFAAEVLRAEGMAPEREQTWVRRIKHRFTDRFGSVASRPRKIH